MGVPHERWVATNLSARSNCATLAAHSSQLAACQRLAREPAIMRALCCCRALASCVVSQLGPQHSTTTTTTTTSQSIEQLCSFAAVFGSPEATRSGRLNAPAAATNVADGGVKLKLEPVATPVNSKLEAAAVRARVSALRANRRRKSAAANRCLVTRSALNEPLRRRTH